MSAQSHQSDPRILNRRTLERDHPRLSAYLRPGMRVLDVGCGTGAITSGIARAVGPDGSVVGIDRDESLLRIARSNSGGLANLRFESGDATTLEFAGRFDLVTAARTLQWISKPNQALIRFRDAVRPGGRVVVLDYNHAANRWEPDPPPAFMRFYDAFLTWRSDRGWNNRIGDELPDMFAAAGLQDIHSTVDDQVAERGAEAASIWTHVMETMGRQIVADGVLQQSGLQDALESYEHWRQREMRTQTLVMRTVAGVTPASTRADR